MIDSYINREEQSFTKAIIDSLIQCVLYELNDSFISDKQPLTLTRHEELFMRFINLIHLYRISERSVTFYANELCITPRYLSYIVSSITGLPAKEIIDSHVILEIKMLLETTSLTVQEIAHKLNFPNQSFLGTYFKKAVGVSPEHYRSIQAPIQ